MVTRSLNSCDFSQISGVVVIIPAAGVGRRMGGELPKQYLKINQKTVLDITLEKFLSYQPAELVVLVTSPEDQHYRQLENLGNEKLHIVDGGKERINSVVNALNYLYDGGLTDDVAVMVHDAARPCIRQSDLDSLLNTYMNNNTPCLLAAPVVDTLQKINGKQQVESVIDRDTVVKAYTPQLASFAILKESLDKAITSEQVITDEVSALTNAGHSVKFVLGRSDNIKITIADDLPLAEFYLNQ